MNKKGLSLPGIFLVMGIAFVVILSLGFLAYSTNYMNDIFNGIGDVGQVNFANASAQTWGEFNSGFTGSLNFMALSIIIGLMIGLLISAYLNRDKNITLFWIVDVILLIIAYIFSTYLSNVYEIVIGVSEFTPTFTNNLGTASTLMLNLPVVVTIFGVLVMIISYAGIPKAKEEQVAGF